jgi:hypothetical protein
MLVLIQSKAATNEPRTVVNCRTRLTSSLVSRFLLFRTLVPNVNEDL